jgi:hypothetical protein
MHAVVHSVTITDPAAAEADLAELLVQITAMPGFYAGFWIGRASDAGIATVMFESEDAAQDFARFLRSVPDAPGVKLDREHIDVSRVLAHAFSLDPT